MTNLIIFDKDWTLVRPRTESTFCEAPWDQKPLNTNIQRQVKELNEEGWEIVVASNQGGVGSRLKSLEACFLEFRFLMEELFPQIKASYFCPDMTGNTCWQMWQYLGAIKQQFYALDVPEQAVLTYEPKRKEEEALFTLKTLGIANFRKPSSGMIDLAVNNFRDLDIDSRIVFVGDRPEDQQAAHRAEIGFMWAQTFSTEEL